MPKYPGSLINIINLVAYVVLDSLYANPTRIVMVNRVIAKRDCLEKSIIGNHLVSMAIILYERNIYKCMLLRKRAIKLPKSTE